MPSNHLRRRPGHASVLAAVAGGALLAGVLSAPAAGAGTATALFAAPKGHGSACTATQPCALPEAQDAARAARADGTTDVSVTLADGTYRLTEPLDFAAADSGSPGHPVVWAAAPGAHPVLSGATRVRTWSATGTDGVWAAHVPVDSATRQLYVDGTEAHVAQATPAALHFAGGWHGSSTGYDLSDDPAAQSFFAALTPDQLQQVEFDYLGGNGAWTDTKCRVDALTGSSLVMDQPCWTDATDRASFRDGSGGLPSMSTSQLPTTVQNAASLLHPGQWFLDADTDTLYYDAPDGASPAAHDVELPRLQTLVQGAGTLAHPVHDLTFTGLTFSYATWNAPSGDAGFADVQSNLHMTGANNQGMCTFSSPAGTCPWGLLTEPHANVSFTAADDVTLTGNRFVNLGGAGLRIAYGSSHNLVQGNEFTKLASTSILLGCTADPTPVNPDPKHFPDYAATNPDTPQTIKDNCTPDPAAVAGDKIGSNEIATDNTISDNVIHEVGTDYRSASGLTLLFTRGTTITHNELYDLPYTGITAGVIQGHVDLAAHQFNSLNINADNTLSDNLIHDHMQLLSDGGAIYMEGHQAAYRYAADGTTLDFDKTLAHGLQVRGNVTYNQQPGFAAFYDDAGSEWIHYRGNVQFHPLAGIAAQGGCAPDGHFLVEQNWFASSPGQYVCADAVDSHVENNTTIPAAPGPGDVPLDALAAAGPTAAFRGLAEATAVEATYVSAPQQVTSQHTTTTQVLVGGAGFSAGTPVFFGGRRAADVRVLSPGFLIATAPAGSDGTDVSVGGFVPAPTITAPANGATGVGTTYSVQGTGESGDTVTVSEGEATACAATVAAGAWSCTVTGAAPGQHTLTAVQHNRRGFASKPASTVFVVGTPPAEVRINDTDPGFGYDGLSYSSNRGYGDYQDDLHYAQDNGATVTYTFVGTGIKVFGEQYTDQGDIGVSVDGGPQQTVSTVPTDGQRHSNVVVWSAGGLSAGVHTIVVTKVSGTYLTFDGVEVDNG